MCHLIECGRYVGNDVIFITNATQCLFIVKLIRAVLTYSDSVFGLV